MTTLPAQPQHPTSRQSSVVAAVIVAVIAIMVVWGFSSGGSDDSATGDPLMSEIRATCSDPDVPYYIPTDADGRPDWSMAMDCNIVRLAGDR